MSDLSYNDLPALFGAVALPSEASTIINQDTGAISSMYTFEANMSDSPGMTLDELAVILMQNYDDEAPMTTPSTPVLESKDLTADERAAILARTPPYDGVRTAGDLLTVRERLAVEPKKEKKEKA